MASRLSLQSLFETFTNNVYYQSPVNTKMDYPAIKYSRSNIDSIHADDNPYHHDNKYEVIVIDRAPDSQIIDKILTISTVKHLRHYVSDGLNHDVFTIYW